MEVKLRKPNIVMKLSRLGSFHQSKLSFLRSFLKEFKAAPHLTNSWNSIPHVTHHDEADVSELEDFRLSLKDQITGERKKVSPLVFIIKSLVSTLKKFPNFNSSIDEIKKGKITLKKYFHIGIAVDTEHGLMVPKIRDVNKKNFNQLSG